jgi:hypothetical protein
MKSFEAGDRLIANNGNRCVDVEDRNGVLWAVPVVKFDGMDPQPLQWWLDGLLYGASRIVKA